VVLCNKLYTGKYKSGTPSKRRIIRLIGVNKATFFYVGKKNLIISKKKSVLLSIIKRIYDESDQIYGAPKILAKIKGQYSYFTKLTTRTVSNYMKELGIRSITVPTKYRTQSKGNSELPFNLPFMNYIKKDKPIKPHTHILTDITYIKTINDGWIYKLTFMDLFTRKVLKWDVSNKMTSEWVNRIAKELINEYKSIEYIHSDRGSQYTAVEYVKMLLMHGISPSYSAKGYPYHNAWIESYHAQIKKECIYRVKILNLKEAKRYCFNYIEGFYNTNRIQKALGYISPLDYELRHLKS
jgi:putative transposase